MRAGAIVLGLAVLLFLFFENRPSPYPPGVLVPREPDQYPTVARTWTKNGFRITALASFRLEALVLSTERYWSDPGSAISPVDVALGWGPMSDTAAALRVRISQSSRFYWYRGGVGITLDEVAAHSANMHMIPSDDQIESRLKSLRRGDVASLRGFLVEAEGPNGNKWRSSLTRTDRGGGSCELVWVEEASRVPPESL
jgi:hypothetical protein